VANGLIINPLFGGPGIGGAFNYLKQGMLPEAAKEYADVVGINFLGFKFSDGTIWTPNMLTNYATIGVAVLGHILAKKFGVNRYMSKIPMIGKYISL